MESGGENSRFCLLLDRLWEHIHLWGLMVVENKTFVFVNGGLILICWINEIDKLAELIVSMKLINMVVCKSLTSLTSVKIAPFIRREVFKKPWVVLLVTAHNGIFELYPYSYSSLHSSCLVKTVPCIRQFNLPPVSKDLLPHDVDHKEA
ncbi:hypothetical protein Tco_1286938 [Tanacetum coccineum]